ncbi:MAG: hypothetical protein SV062_11070 [Thermodesulfobacteriota bacterium]|nr:hypothetical protein [Thermodesulfobacteriota bacterium]
MPEIKEITQHIAGDIEKVQELVGHIKKHMEKAIKICNAGNNNELGEIGKHLLEIDAKVHELYHHITKKEVLYNPHKDFSVKEE